MLRVISEIVPRDRLLDRAREIAGPITKLPRLTASYTRVALTQNCAASWTRALAMAWRWRESLPLRSIARGNSPNASKERASCLRTRNFLFVGHDEAGENLTGNVPRELTPGAAGS